MDARLTDGVQRPPETESLSPQWRRPKQQGLVVRIRLNCGCQLLSAEQLGCQGVEAPLLDAGRHGPRTFENPVSPKCSALLTVAHRVESGRPTCQVVSEDDDLAASERSCRAVSQNNVDGLIEP